MSDDPTNTRTFDAHQHARVMAQALRLTIEDAWQDPIANNLVMLEQTAQLVLEVDLPDEIESALVFAPHNRRPE